MGAAFPTLVDRLLAVLRAAQSELEVGCSDRGREALAEAFAILGALYATLDSGRHPELSNYLQTVYDRCLQRIGEAGAGRFEELSVAIVLLGQIREAEQGAQERAWVSDYPRESVSAMAV